MNQQISAHICKRKSFSKFHVPPTRLEFSIVIKFCDISSPDYLVSSDAFCFYAGICKNQIKPQNPAVNCEKIRSSGVLIFILKINDIFEFS